MGEGQACPVCRAHRVGAEAHCQGCGHTYVEVDQWHPDVQLPSGSALPRGHRTRWPVLVVGALLAAAALGTGAFAAISDEGPTLPNVGRDSAGQTPETTPLRSGTWSGEMGSDDVALALDVAGNVAKGVYRVRTAQGVVGSWMVAGTSENGELNLKPDSWISRPNGWSRGTLRLQRGPDDSLQGSSSGGDKVDLRLIGTGVPDAETVAADWRTALAMTEDQARKVLEQRRVEGKTARDSLNGAWVAQVASGCEGLDQGSWVLTASSILATGARLGQDLGAITVRWDDIATSEPGNCPGTDMWVSVVPRRFASSKAALRWCWRNADSCAARYIVPRGQKGTRIAY